MPSVRINTVNGPVNNAGSMVIHHIPAPDGTQSQHFYSGRSSSPVNVPAATQPQSNVASHGSSLNSSPPQSDSGPSSMSSGAGRERDFPLPTPVADTSSPDGRAGEGGDSQSPTVPAPTPVEGSTDYVSVGRGNCAGQGVNEGATYDPTAMSELKAGETSDGNTGMSTAQAGQGVNEGATYDPTAMSELKGGETSDGNTGMSTAQDGEAAPTSDLRLSEATQLKQVAADRTVDSQSSLECDSPVQTPAFLQDTSSAAPSSLADRSLPSMQSQPETTSVVASAADERQTFAEGFSGTDADRACEHSDRSSGGQRETRSLPEDFWSVPSVRLCENQTENRDGEASAASLLTDGSAPSSLCADRGGEESSVVGAGAITPHSPQGGAGSDIFVVHYKGFLLPDVEEPNVFVVDYVPAMDVLENASQTGTFAAGSSQLMQMRWLGHRDFDLSLWKLTLKSAEAPPNRQLQDLAKHLCDLLLDADVTHLRDTLKQLQKRHSIFLHRIVWDGGLGVYLGHTNPQKRAECMWPPMKNEVRSLLIQLLPDWALDVLSWEEPAPRGEEEEEAESTLALPDVGDRHSSVNTEDLYASSEGSSISRSLTQQTSSAGSSMRALGMFSGARDPSRDLERQVEAIRKSLQQVQLRHQQEVATQAESHSEEMGKLRQECQAISSTISQMQKVTEEWMGQVGQQMSRMDAQLQDQKKMMEEMDRKHQQEKKAAQEEMNQAQQKLIEELKRQHQQDQMKLADEIKAQLPRVMEEMNKQVMQHEMRQKSEGQAVLMEILKLRKEMDDRFRALPPGGAVSTVVGMAEMGSGEGAVGGVSLGRNVFSTALDESEQATSKLKGKEEEMTSNQLEDRIRLPPMSEAGASGLDQASKSGLVMVESPQTGEGATPGMDPSAMNGSAAPQNGARSKRPVGKTKSTGSPPSERKLDSVRESSQERAATSASQESGEDQEGDLSKAEQFLDWVHFRGDVIGSQEISRTITKHVQAALKEEETPAPRAKCLDTILCLDVSESIIREGCLDTVKRTALDFVDGIEDLMDEMDLEENIAVVAVGGHARVVQHLTNDLTLVRGAIESLDDSGGRSPFIQALLVCFAANKGRGGTVNISGVYKVRPRIIFITDGRPTDEAQETGHDLQSNVSQTNFSLVQLLSQLASKKHKTSPRPINWVPVGHRADQKFLQSLADLSGGELVVPGEIQRLCRYYKVQQTIGRLFKMVKNQDKDFITDVKIKELLMAIAANSVTEKEREFIVEEVKKLQKAPVDDDDDEADGYDNIFEDEEKVKNAELLALGTRVVRGPDWKWKNQDTAGPGTVIQHSRKDNWIYVKWDNGTYNAYRYGEEGKSDIVETQHHPRLISPDSQKLDFGVRVIRGPNWKAENQDGRGPGTVIRCKEADEKVQVRWDKTGKIHEYSFSQTKGKEVQIYLPEFKRNPHNPGEGMNLGAGQPEDDADKTIPMWKWRDQLQQWRLYNQETSDKLESEFQKRPQASCVITRAGRSRRVSFKLWQEKTVDGGATAEVMREMVDEERKNDLLAIELSLQDP